jgi:hypothetical protein
MIDKAKEAQVDISGNPTIIVLNNMLFVQGSDGERAALGEVTHERLNDMQVAFMRMNAHLFPELVYSEANAILASKK